MYIRAYIVWVVEEKDYAICVKKINKIGGEKKMKNSYKTIPKR